jgi:hypothetical protein
LPAIGRVFCSDPKLAQGRKHPFTQQPDAMGLVILEFQAYFCNACRFEFQQVFDDAIQILDTARQGQVIDTAIE